MSESGQKAVQRELEQFRQKFHALNRRIAAQSDGSEFATVNRLVDEQGAFRLREFGDGTDDDGEPVLIVYSHVNRPGIIDIDAEHSLVRRLMETGNRVFLMDWQRTRPEDRTNELSLYVLDAISEALDTIRERTSRRRINLMGICQGGTFALCHACLRPRGIGRLALLVTPVDFHRGDSLIAHWSRHVDFQRLVSHPVNIPGGLITTMFQFARPFDDLKRQVRLIHRSGSDDDLGFSLRMDRWAYDCPDQPGRAFAQFMQCMYRDNALVGGSLEISGEAVRLDRIDLPVMNVFAENDHLVPPESSAALVEHLRPGTYDEMRFCGGHIGLMVSARAQVNLLPGLGKWLSVP